MAKAKRLSEFEYVLECDRSESDEDQTVFVLRPLTFREHEQLARQEFSIDRKTERAVMTTDTLSMARKVLNMGLMGWSNFADSEGKEIPFEINGRVPRAIKDDLLDLLTPYAVELSNAITDSSELDEGTAKNSG